MSTLHALTPTYRPAGGVVKVFDYVTHALAAGYDVVVHCSEPYNADDPVFALPRLQSLVDDPRVRFHQHKHLRVQMGHEDLALVSLPDHLELVQRVFPRGMSPERIIHLVQNTRHANPTWRGGFPTRLLTRPASRISINAIVADAITPLLDDRALHQVIPLGHELDFFARERADIDTTGPLKVGYTTWKSDVGDRVAALMDGVRLGGREVEFRAIREAVEWHELRELYHWADVFLSAPGEQEGLYLPGLEAMAASTLVITPDVGGNMAYCRPEENCLLVDFEDAEGYAAALGRLAGADPTSRSSLLDAGRAVGADFSLDAERSAFHAFLDTLWERIGEQEQERTRSLRRARGETPSSAATDGVT